MPGQSASERAAGAAACDTAAPADVRARVTRGAAKTPPPASLAWGIWGLGAAFYLFAFYFRVAPAVLTVELTNEFRLSAAALGKLSAIYFFSYVVMQVPTGIAADRWGPRRLLAAGAMVAGGGTLLFALARGPTTASAGRLLVGGSVAVSFVGMLKLASHWFAPRQFAFASGMTLLVGVAGAVLAGVPLRAAVDAFGWRAVMTASGLVALALATSIWLVVRDDPREKGFRSYFTDAPAGAARSATGGLREVLSYRNTWLLAFVPGGIAGTLTTFAGLWGVPYLVQHYRLSTRTAAGLCSLLMTGWALGGPAFGALSDRLGRRKPLYAGGTVAVALGWSVLLLASPPYPLLVALLTAVGFASGCMMVGFAFAKESVPAPLAGTVSGVVNTGVMAGAMVLQPAVGWLLDRRWTGAVEGASRAYGIDAYRAGFGLMLAWLAASTVAVMLTRETWCRPLGAVRPRGGRPYPG